MLREPKSGCRMLKVSDLGFRATGLDVQVGCMLV